MKNIASATLLAAALGAGAAQAQDPVDGSSQALAASALVMGGATASVSGGGGDMTIQYAGGAAGGGSAFRTQVPRMAAVTNGRLGAGNALTPEYTEPERAPPGREAWLVGGGEDAQVVYDRPR